MRSVLDGSLEAGAEYIHEMHFCLDCQACETACPAGVRYGTLVEDARTRISDAHHDPRGILFVKRVLLKWVLSSRRRTALAASFLRMYERCGLREAVDESGILGLFSDRLRQKHAMLPHVVGEPFNASIGEFVRASGVRRGTVALLSGCIMNVAFADVHRDTVAVLTRNGFDVIIPAHQGCCGSLHGHNGEREEARMLARKSIDLFGLYDFDSIIVNSAGCGAFLKEYHHLLVDDPVYANLAQQFSSKTRDVTEFLADVGLTEVPGKLNVCVTYHEACHLVHTQKISTQPRSLIAAIPGVEFVELPEATWCCGSAGIYNVTHFDDSIQILDRKMTNLESTKADIVVTTNPGCHLQLQHGIRQRGLQIEVLHPVTLLRKAYES